MSFSLDQVVPWGRSFDEYVAMFALSAEDLRRSFVGCGDGPASFNADLSARGGRIISIDPLYQFSAEQIATRIDETYEIVMEQTRRNRHEFVWNLIPSVADLGRARMAAMRRFLADYDLGKRDGRYLPASLPSLPFRDCQFDLVLCSHFLFLYSEQRSLEFHIASILEMMRVSKEARIFPLLELGAVRSRHLDAILEALQGEQCSASVQRVPYEFQRGGNEMLRVRRSEA